MCISIVAHVCKCLPFSLHICMYIGMTDWCLVAAMDCVIAAAAARALPPPLSAAAML